MHMRYYKLPNREEATKSLMQLYDIDQLDLKSDQMVIIDEGKISENISYNEVLLLANTPDRWDELDYVMSKYPVDEFALNTLLAKWKGH